MNSKLLSIIAVLIGILLPMKVSAQMGDYISAPEFTFEGDNIVMTCETQGANIYYVMSEFANEEEAYSLSEALDVSEANSMRTLYTQPFPVTSNVVIKAVAKMPQQQGESEVTTLIYSYTAWSGLLSAIEYGSKVQERAKDSPLVSDDLKEQLQWALEEGQMIYGYRGQMPDSHEAEHFAEEILQIAHEIEEILNQQPAIAEVMLTGKNANYWYDETGTDPNGDEAVVFTLPENPDGGNFWEVNVLNTFIRNQLAFTTPEGEAVDNITGEFRFESEGNMVALNDGKMLMYESADEQGEIAMIEPGMGMMRIINNEITQRLLNEPNSQFMALPVNVMAYQDGNEVPVINGRFTVLVRLEKQQKEPEPYAVLSQNNTVLTFYYDTNKERMNGMSVGPFSNPESRGWHDYREIITTVVFDATFANCTTLTRTAYWFRDCKNLTTIIGISNLKTDHVTNMNSMFEWCTSLTNLDVSGFKTDNVTSMQGLFWYCSSLTSLDVSNFNTDNVTNMYGVFTGCSSLVNIDVSHFNTDNVTDMCSLFDGCSSLKSVELSNFNTAKVWRTFGMFRNCTSLTSLDLSSFNMESVEDMGDMFRNCSNLKTIYVSNEWITSNVTKSSYMFEDCTSLVGGAGTHYHADHIDHTYARIDGGPNSQTPGYFTRSGDEPWVDPVEPEPYAVLSQNNTVMTYYYDEKKTERNGINWGEWDEQQKENVTSLIIDASFANYTTITSTEGWFSGYKNMTQITGLEYLNTSNVTTMYAMFYECISLTSLDVSHFDTKNVTNMRSMFQYCSALTSLDLSNFNTENVTNMISMFDKCYALEILDLSGFNTTNVTGMSWMFVDCGSLKTIYVGDGWTTTSIDESQFMFFGCYDLVGGAGTHYDEDYTDYTYAHIDGGTTNPGYLTRSGDRPWIDDWFEPYAVLSRNNTVMTFYYDDQMEERGGISLEDDRWEGRERELSSSIVALVFDDSFSDYVVNEVEDFSINLDGWTSLAAVRAGNVRIPTDEYAKVGNPNLLVYVNEPSLAPQGVQNVVVNGLAREIVLTNATEGNNNWHCPEPFRAEKITYTRNFRQQTEVGISRGWESIALPFTVQTITHEAQGRIIPFGAQGSGKYFWLRGYSPEGLHRATVLEANTPYVISMPNNPTVYPAQYNLNGRVTFSAENTTVPATPEFEEMLITRGNITMAPIFVVVPQDEAVYAINVSQPLDRYAEGSVFTRELREVRPFEAATTHEPVNGARPKYIRIAAQPDDDITGIRTIELDETEGTWYSLDGRQMQGQPQRKGVYLQKGKKIVVK